MSAKPQPQEEEELPESPARTAAFWGLCAANVLALALVIWAVGLALRRGQEKPGPATGEPPAAQPANDAPDAPVLVGQEADSSVNLAPVTASLKGQVALSQTDETDLLTGWQAGDTAQWHFKVFKPGVFRVKVDYAAEDDWAGGKYQITANDIVKECDVRGGVGGGAKEFQQDEQHMIAIERSGEHVLQLKALQLAGDQLMVLRSVRLELVQEGQE